MVYLTALAISIAICTLSFLWFRRFVGKYFSTLLRHTREEVRPRFEKVLVNLSQIEGGKVYLKDPLDIWSHPMVYLNGYLLYSWYEGDQMEDAHDVMVYADRLEFMVSVKPNRDIVLLVIPRT